MPHSTADVDATRQFSGSSGPIAEQLSADLSNRALEVPLLPSIVTQVLSFSLDDAANAARLADLIQQDQGLASHMLRVVNSAAFRGSTEIVALQQAIARLGMERIREIALTVSLKGTLFNSEAYACELDATWKHALRTGLWAKEISRAVRKNVEVAYLCGLLHNVGEPLLINRIAALDTSLEGAQVQALLDAFGRDAGVILADEWALPAAVTLAITFQDRLSEAKNAQDLVATVDAAKYLARLLEEIEDAERAAETISVESVLERAELQHLNFYPDDVEALFGHISRVNEVVAGMAA